MYTIHTTIVAKLLLYSTHWQFALISALNKLKMKAVFQSTFLNARQQSEMRLQDTQLLDIDDLADKPSYV